MGSCLRMNGRTFQRCFIFLCLHILICSAVEMEVQSHGAVEVVGPMQKNDDLHTDVEMKVKDDQVRAQSRPIMRKQAASSSSSEHLNLERDPEILGSESATGSASEKSANSLNSKQELRTSDAKMDGRSADKTVARQEDGDEMRNQTKKAVTCQKYLNFDTPSCNEAACPAFSAHRRRAGSQKSLCSYCPCALCNQCPGFKD
eukprot:TRINITY_DN85042_c0_g1_i1.p1 TRINITY_DN85042_c0_g1~~TRINITY_DN85042_c0_g1_i1.p1  ORF type:complete len:202 (+),score=37.17 TRINITY_DN85042_c0_g1_i1:59-664(+)